MQSDFTNFQYNRVEPMDVNLIPTATQDCYFSKLSPVLPLRNSPNTSQTVISVVQA